MLADIRTAVRLGADGIVAGALLPDGGIDTEFLRRCLDAADGLPFTFHRAFDLCSDPRKNSCARAARTLSLCPAAE